MIHLFGNGCFGQNGSTFVDGHIVHLRERNSSPYSKATDTNRRRPSELFSFTVRHDSTLATLITKASVSWNVFSRLNYSHPAGALLDFRQNSQQGVRRKYEEWVLLVVPVSGYPERPARNCPNASEHQRSHS